MSSSEQRHSVSIDAIMRVLWMKQNSDPGAFEFKLVS